MKMNTEVVVAHQIECMCPQCTRMEEDRDEVDSVHTKDSGFITDDTSRASDYGLSSDDDESSVNSEWGFESSDDSDNEG